MIRCLFVYVPVRRPVCLRTIGTSVVFDMALTSKHGRYAANPLLQLGCACSSHKWLPSRLMPSFECPIVSYSLLTLLEKARLPAESLHTIDMAATHSLPKLLVTLLNRWLGRGALFRSLLLLPSSPVPPKTARPDRGTRLGLRSTTRITLKPAGYQDVAHFCRLVAIRTRQPTRANN